MNETQLCEKFISAADEDGWTVYPEVKKWDMVLVWENDPLPAYDLQTGDQVAVEAKTRANVKSIHQAITRSRGAERPNFRAVLAPRASSEFQYVAGRLKVGVFTLQHCGPWQKGGKSSYEYPRKTVRPPQWRFDPSSQLWLPPVVPDIQAGASSPRALTPWRVAALKLCKILDQRGWVTSKDFKALDLSMKIWKGRKNWLRHDGKVGRCYRYVKGSGKGFPSKGWETEMEAIKISDDERYDYG